MNPNPKRAQYSYANAGLSKYKNMCYYAVEPYNICYMNQFNTTHLAYGVFLFFIICITLWACWKRKHKLIEEIIQSLKTTIDSFHQITFSEYYGLPQGCALKTDEWHVGYTVYFACNATLALDSIVGILLIDLSECKYEIIHRQEDIAHERQIIILKKGRRTFKMFVTHGVKSNEDMNLFSVHIEVNH